MMQSIQMILFLEQQRKVAQQRSDKAWREFLCGKELEKIFAAQEADKVVNQKGDQRNV